MRVETLKSRNISEDGLTPRASTTLWPCDFCWRYTPTWEDSSQINEISGCMRVVRWGQQGGGEGPGYTFWFDYLVH